jgi:hypothetical protein
MAIPMVSWISSVCLHIYILHFLDIRMFKFKFELRVHQIHFKLFGGKYLEVWNARNHACHTWAHRPPRHTQRPPSSWPTFEVLPKVAKNQKNGKNMAWAHDMWCIHTKYTNFGIPSFWVMGSSQPCATKNMTLRLACLIIWPRWINEDGFSKKHSKLSNLGPSHITKHPIVKRWSNGCHWVTGFAPTITIEH